VAIELGRAVWSNKYANLMKPRHVIALTLASIIAVGLFLVGVALFSRPGQWYVGLYLGQRDYNYITDLRDRFEENPTNLVLLDKIIARTKNVNSLSRVNAIGVLSQLSFFNSPTGKQIHATVLPIFVRALYEKDQSSKRVVLEGLENLGPYALSAIPDIKKKLNDSDPIIQQEAQRTLAELGKYQNQ